MHQQISKKLLLYFFLLIIFGTINNKNLILFEFFKIKEINIVDIDFKDNQNFLSNLNLFKKQNILFLSEIDIKKTNFLAYLKKDNELFLIGSNGRLIKTKDKIKDLPHIFGNFENKDFFKLKNIIDKSDLDFEKIDNLYFFPSGRWDIETNFGIMIKLPSENLKESLELSLEIIKDKKFDNIKIIDLRQNNQVIVDG